MCKSLKKIRIPDSIEEIGQFAFDKCISLEEFHIPNSIRKIDEGVFHCCKTLRKLEVPRNVTHLGYVAFTGCEALEKISILGSVDEIDCSAFFKCKSLKEVYIAEGTQKIKNYAFEECISFNTIKIPDSIEELTSNVFSNCKSIKKILWKGKEYTVRCINGVCMNVLHEKDFNGCKFSKCTYFPNSEVEYIIEKDGYTAYGENIREAMIDLEYKLSSNEDRASHIIRIAKQGYMSAPDYCLLTGADREGVKRFLKEHQLTWDDTLPVKEVLELARGQFGFFAFENAAKEILSLMKH